MDCRIHLAQVEPTLGNLDKNLRDHLTEIQAAVEARAELVVFPELSLTGYFLKDQTAEVALALDAPPLRQLAERSKDISIAVGFAERAVDGRVYNSIAFLEDGRVLGVHRKVHLVHYGMFDEGRDFAAGESFVPIESRLGKFGFLICEDMWHLAASWIHFLAGVDAIVVPSSSPGRGVTEKEARLRSTQVWYTLQDALALFYQTWIVYVNRVGSEDGVCFSGGSRIVDPFGREIARLDGLEPGRLGATLTTDALNRARISTPLRRDEKPWIVQRALAPYGCESGG
ncbi:MAG: nitrilase-related carbon-nitrogen hydrolase [Planctomycetota bacterium]